MMVRKRRYTLVYHSYIGYGSYVVYYRKVTASIKDLESYARKGDLHFIIKGWPQITHPDGQPIEYETH